VTSDPTPLPDLQRWFTRVITHPDGLEAGLRASTPQLTAAEATLPSSRLSAVERLAIYHDGYHARLIECLADDYPALRHALGHAQFRSLCLAYIAKFPSRSPSLNYFGAHMPGFCASDPLQLTHAQGLAELAQLEWAVVEAIHAEAQEPLPIDSLSALGPEQFARATLLPNPALAWLEHTYPVHTYYKAFWAGKASPLLLPPNPSTPDEAQLADATWLSAADEPLLVCVYRTRRTFAVQHSVFTRAQAALLRALLAGQPVVQALSAAVDSGMGTVDVQQSFERFFSAGLFTGLHI